MAWIESHTILTRHRKVIELARELRLRKSYIMGHLHALWHAALEQAESGDLSQWSDELIAEMSDYPGDAPQYVRLLQKYGFLDGKILHDWIDYSGKYLISKYSTSNPGRLVEIWQIHGRAYGVNRQRVNSDQIAIEKKPLHNITLPNLTEPKTKDVPQKRKHSFENSPFFDFKVFREALKDWSEARCKDYYERAKRYSGANGGKYLNWILAVQNWERSDADKSKSAGSHKKSTDSRKSDSGGYDFGVK